MSGDDELNSINLPSHGSIPKWLEDITDSVNKQGRIINAISGVDATSRKSSLHTIGDCLSSSDIPSTSEKLSESRNSSAKYGRRSSITSQLNAITTPKNISLTPSEYLLPNLDETYDFSILQNQESLEKSWKSLSLFEQSHKGRLDSANINDEQPQRISDYFEAILSPISSNYEPSTYEKNVPTRSQSEMSYAMPQYVYSNIRKATEYNHDPLSHKETMSHKKHVNKSKSSENVYKNGRFYDDYFGSQESLSSSFLGGKIGGDYRLKVAKENQLRQQIINELLSENERITEHLEDRRFLRSPSLNDLTFTPQTNPQSKYKRGFMGDYAADFIIPELPSGQILVINIISTWGDKYYVGMNGIEIFGDDGKIIQVKKISASPADVNVLPEVRNDPRIVKNLLDGINRTQDDVHLWLAPFNKGENHTIRIEFYEICLVSMIRIWNYNKSRIHSYRGVKDILISLDHNTIFKGDIAKACGGIIGGVDAFGDTILFTVDSDILDLISKYDHSFPTLTSTKIDSPINIDRPPTSALSTSDGMRPYTGLPQDATEISDEPDQILLGAKHLDIALISNWGFADVIGLAGLEVIQGTDTVLYVNPADITSNTSSPKHDLHHLFNGDNVTCDGNAMWYTQYKYGDQICIGIDFDDFVYISGIRIWNYNASVELTYAGVSRVKIFLDGKPIANPSTKEDVFILRRAPGNVHYDFVQEIRFSESDSIVHTVQMNPSFIIASNNRPNQESDDNYEKSWIPEGFVFEIIIFSTWGDQYYCGLNGLEFYDYQGRKICLEESNICAYPESVNVLPNVSGDVRTPDKLIDNINENKEGIHAWLAPIIPKCINKIYIVLDQPMAVSVIKLWNYSKTPNRGVKEFGIRVDDLLIYNGTLEKYSSKIGSRKYGTVLFTDDVNVIQQESETLVKQNPYDQDTLLLNNQQRTTTGGSLPNADPALRPFTAVSPFNRGYTSQSH